MNDSLPLHIVELTMEDIKAILPPGTVVVDAMVQNVNAFFRAGPTGKVIYLKVSHPCSPLVPPGQHLITANLETFRRHAERHEAGASNVEPNQHSAAGQQKG